MNKELINRVRTILLLAAQDEQNKITPKAIMNRFECSIEDAINYIKIIESYHLGESNGVCLNCENQGWITLNIAGLQKAEDMRNEKRWNIVLNVCKAIDSYTINVTFEILNRCIVFEIQNEISKQYNAQ